MIYFVACWLIEKNKTEVKTSRFIPTNENASPLPSALLLSPSLFSPSSYSSWPRGEILTDDFHFHLSILLLILHFSINSRCLHTVGCGGVLWLEGAGGEKASGFFFPFFLSFCVARWPAFDLPGHHYFPAGLTRPSVSLYLVLRLSLSCGRSGDYKRLPPTGIIDNHKCLSDWRLPD